MDVYCQMATATISAYLCEQEQGAKGCVGCRAPSRRCRTCGASGALAFPAHGYCAECAGKKGIRADVARSDIPDGDVAAAFETRSRAIAGVAPEGAALPSRGEKHWRTGEFRELDAAASCESLLPLLQEHAAQRVADGPWIVKNPIRVLMVRASLLPDEASAVLDELAARGIGQGIAPWDSMVLASGCERAIAEADEDVGPQEREFKASRPLPMLPSDHTAFERSAAAEVRSDFSGSGPGRGRRSFVTRQANEVGEFRALRVLASRASDLTGETIVRSPVQVLRADLHVSVDAAEKLLERLLADGRCEQRDGWRVIALQDAAVMEAPPAIAASGGVSAGALPQVSRDRPLIPATPTTRRISKGWHARPRSSASLPTGRSDDDAGRLPDGVTLAGIMTELSALRVENAAMAARVGALETALAELRQENPCGITRAAPEAVLDPPRLPAAGGSIASDCDDAAALLVPERHADPDAGKPEPEPAFDDAAASELGEYYRNVDVD